MSSLDSLWNEHLREMPLVEQVWRESFRARFSDCEPNGLVSAAALCRYFQQAADHQCAQHGVSLAEMHASGRMWVLSRFAMRVHRFPGYGEDVVLETWPSGVAGGLRCYRDFRIRSAGGEEIAEGRTVWFALDLATRRPVRAPCMLLDASWPASGEERPDARKLLSPAAFAQQCEIVARYSDLDANGHASSACYLEWLLEPLPRSLRTDNRLDFIDVVFHNEVLAGERIISGFEEGSLSGSPRTFRHALRSHTGQALATACTQWV